MNNNNGKTHLNTLEHKIDDLQEDMAIYGSALAHDIRPSIANMAEYCSQLNLLHHTSKDTETRELIELLNKEIERTQGSFSILLEYARINNSKLKPKPIDTNEIINSILINHREQIHTIGANVTHDSLPIVEGNRVYISHIFNHLLENALKFRKPEETCNIHIGFKENDGMAEFYVKDNGIGIAEEFHKIIFILFQRLHPSDEIEGDGAGLALCKKIIELHGGTIRVESAPNEGTTIFFTLPADLTTNNSTHDHVDEDIINVLLVEDMKSDADALQQVLAHNNLNSDLHIATESKLETGLEYIAHHKTDVVFVDLGLPDVKGIDVIDTIRAKHPNLPIIVFSGNSNKELITEALQHGAQQFLVKGECSGLVLKNSIYQALAQ